jgi:hypothetical protein
MSQKKSNGVGERLGVRSPTPFGNWHSENEVDQQTKRHIDICTLLTNPVAFNIQRFLGFRSLKLWQIATILHKTATINFEPASAAPGSDQ